MKTSEELQFDLNTEQEELSEKMNKLREFMKTEEFETLGDDVQRLMEVQLNAMEQYLVALIHRLDAAKGALGIQYL